MPKKKFINKKEICLFASELSNLIGISNFKPPAVTLLRIWEKNFPEDYRLHKQYVADQDKELALNESSNFCLLPETFKTISSSLDNNEILSEDDIDKTIQTLEKLKQQKRIQCQNTQYEMFNKYK